jgi:hypothetical protein
LSIDRQEEMRTVGREQIGIEELQRQHSPFGAFASFTAGLVDSPDGFGQSLRGRPAERVGSRPVSTEWQLLPF